MSAGFVITCPSCGRYKKAAGRLGACKCGGAFVRRAKVPQDARKRPGPRATAAELEGMRAAYEAGASCVAVGKMFPRKNGAARHQGDVRRYLVTMGVALRPSAMTARPRDEFNRVLPFARLTDAEVRAEIAAMPPVTRDGRRFNVPARMKNEWRGYTRERRAWVIGLLSAKFPSSMPKGAFSAGVMPFDCATPEAMEIAAEANMGLPAQKFRTRLFACSEGVIFEGALWFWRDKVGYQLSEWTPGRGRPILHHVLWERANGRAVPSGHVVRFADGNANNFEPANLVLESRGDLACANKSASLTKKSRALTALLLRRSQHPTPNGNKDSDLCKAIRRA